MSIGTAMSAALSGLAANARAAATVSSNIANAQTEGYARREVELAARILGSTGDGVRVAGERRVQDAALVADLRAAAGAATGAALQDRALARLTAAVGLPGEPGSLTDRLARFEAALVDAVARPFDEARLAAVRDTAAALSGGLNAAGRAVTDARAAADASIAGQVARLNDGLAQVHRLNADIQRARSAGHSPAALEDLRDRALAGIAEILPIRQMERPGGALVLYTEGGTMLLDTRPAVIGFTPSPVLDATMTQENGALSGLTVNGRPLPTDAARLGSGGLAAAFDLRDRAAVEVQGWLDALAGDLIARFEAPAADPTRAPGDPGLFTDAGAPLSAAPVPGLAGRIAVNAAIDPAAGGALWRLRDGLGAALPGPSGSATGLQRLVDAMAGPADPLPAGAAVARSPGLSDHLGGLLSRLGRTTFHSEVRATETSARLAALKEAAGRTGVDTDAELQALLVIEKAFAANARVIRAADEMLQTLLGITR